MGIAVNHSHKLHHTSPAARAQTEPKTAAKSSEPKDQVTLSPEAHQTAHTGEDIDLAKVTSPADKGKRNQQVTAGYHELSKGMDEVINPPGTPDGGVNWASHATWASKKAGDVIQGKGLPPVGADHVPDAISEGNTRVFKDVAPDFQSFTKTFGNDKNLDQDKFNEWSKRFEANGEDGNLKKEAFDSFYKARFEQDAKKKQEMVLYGNVKVGQYEQKLLDSDIDKAMTPSGVGGGLVRVGDLATENPIDLLRGRNRLRELGTSGGFGLDGMTLDYPDGQGGVRTTRLGQNVPVQPNDDLKSIQDPKLRAAMHEYALDPDKADGGGSACTDWSEYNDRMRYIAQHFRANQSNHDMITQNPQPDVAVDLPREGGPVYTDSPIRNGNSNAYSAHFALRNLSYWADNS